MEALQDFLQWTGISAALGIGIFAMGKKDQKLTDHERRLDEVEAQAARALAITESHGRSITRVETKQDLMYDLLQKMDTKLDQRPHI